MKLTAITAYIPRPGRPRGRSGSPRRWRPGFGVRLAATLVFTITVVGVTQYLLAARQLTTRVVDNTTAGHVADAAVLQRLHAGGGRDPWAPVRELLGHIASRPGVKQVAVIGPDARVVAAGMRHGDEAMAAGASRSERMGAGHGATPMAHAPGGHGSPAQLPHGALAPGRPLPHGRRTIADEVLAGSQAFGGEDPRSSDGDGLYVVPVTLHGRRHALVVIKEPGALAQQLADMRWVLLLTLLVGLPLGIPVFYLLGGRSLTARHTQAINQSTVDALTGVGNHRFFHEELHRMVEVAQRRDKTLSVVVIDLDGFKEVNDTKGHGKGDAVLAHVGELLRSGRAEDAAFRIGGDEFALLMRDTDQAVAERAAERIRARIEAELPEVTASIGVAQLGAPTLDAKTLLASADLALYDAKGAGRNRVVPFRPLDAVPAKGT